MANTRVTTPVTDFDKSTSLPGLKLPSGTNANQPSGVQGMIRNDTGENTGGSTSAIEHHNGTNWQYFAATESFGPNLIMYLNAGDTNSYPPPQTGSTWFDLTSNANNGTISGATWNNTGYFDFNVDSDSVSVSPPINQTFSYSFWVNLDNVSDSLNGGVGFVYDRFFNNYIEMRFEVSFSGNNIRLITSSGSTSSSIFYDATGMSNQWINVIAIGGSTYYSLYIDGNEVNTNTFTYRNLNTTGVTFQIGSKGSQYGLNGKVNNVKLYNTVLTSSEITALEAEGPGVT